MRYLVAFLSLLAVANAQFGSFFDQMFGGQDEGHHGGHHHARQSPNNPSDAAHYRQHYDGGTFFCNPSLRESPSYTLYYRFLRCFFLFFSNDIC